MRTNLILAGIAGVLAIPTTITLVNEGSEFTKLDDMDRLYDGLRKENIHVIQIRKKKTEEEKKDDPPADPNDPNAAAAAEWKVITVRRDDDKWFLAGGKLAGVPVLDYKVNDDLIDRLKEIRKDKDVILYPNATAEELEKTGLTEDQATIIECLDGTNTPLVQLYVGKDASGGEYGQDRVKGFFVRPRAADNDTGRKDVILFEPEQSYWNLSLKEDEWIDTKIHDFEVDKVVEFAVRNPKGEMSFTRGAEDAKPEDKKKWVKKSGPDLGAVRQSEVDNLLSRFQYINVQRYIEPLQMVPQRKLAEYGLAPQAQYEIFAKLEDGSSHKMFVGKKIDDKNEYWARFDGKNHLVAIGDWVVSSFEKEPEEYFDPKADAVLEKDGDDEKKPDDAKPDEKKTDDGAAGDPAKKTDDGAAGDPAKKTDDGAAGDPAKKDGGKK